MSKLSLTGNASGTGTFTIAAPNSNTDRVLTLPDEAGTVLTSASSIPASSVTGLTQGITEADQWRTVANIGLSVGTSDITTQWERVDTIFSVIGSGMSESSGSFTFPSTGIYLISIVMTFSPSPSASDYNGAFIAISTNGGSSYSNRFISWDSASGSDYSSVSGNVIVDVTSTTDFRAIMRGDVSTATTLIGDTNNVRTGLTFIRLGDT